MNIHTCEAIIVTCIDFRFQEYINNWIAENFAAKTYDRVAIAGGVFDLDYMLKQVDISRTLHHIKKVILINHEDCGAYGEEGTHERHIQDLEVAKNQIVNLDKNLKVETIYLHLDSTFEKVSS
ncbi:MAG: hypothetical protein PHE48_03205 [Candidatus Daviesbacteria bacterium]|nr:hypothetical protein [Candidatus Daviesbacteria bacterium]